jgi:hypothetical protein
MNTLQPPLLELSATIQPRYAREATIDERCDAFIKANPKVWHYFIALCLQVKHSGARQWSSKAAFEVMRYMATLQSVGEDFKLPNDFTSRFSRRAMQEVPELQGFFETRCLREKHRD